MRRLASAAAPPPMAEQALLPLNTQANNDRILPSR
jgi:hypothetical protein